MKNSLSIFNLIICMAFMLVSCEEKTSQKNESNLPVSNSIVKDEKIPSLVKYNQPIETKDEKNLNEKNLKVTANINKPNFDIKDIATNFKQLQKMNKTPIFVDLIFLKLCRSVMPNEIEDSKKENGPHIDAAINIYMDTLAAEAFKAKSYPYPVGSIVIKDKNASESAESIQNNHGVGGMLKREKGFDTEHGDWEYFFFKDINKIDKGKIDSCIQCHSRASEKDYVFGKWRKQMKNEK